MPANWRNVKRLAAGTVAMCATGMLSTIALADDTGGSPPVFFMTWDASNDAQNPFTYDPFNFGSREWGTWNLGGGPNGTGGAPRTRTGWRYEGGLNNSAWTMSWDCVVNEDPFVDATINVTNNSNAVQTFWVYMPLNINPSIPGGSFMTSYVSAVVSDNTFDFATFESDGVNPVFQAYIDGVALGASAQLWHPGYQLSAGPFGANNDDDTLINQLGPAVNNQIALRLHFNLSPGDSASVTGTFEVQPIPGPAALGVFALFGAMTGRRRRS